MESNRTENPRFPRWRRTLYIMVFCQVITAFGFSSIFPFLSLYVKSLGSAAALDTDMLAGLVFSGQALTMMIASPVWGALADRWGRKLMVERAMFGGALILGMMAFVRSAEELVLLRAVQGLITGTVGAANALVAAVVPRERTGYAMGLMQVGLAAGVATGPVVGGVTADAYGYPAAFFVTSALLALAGVVVWAGVDEKFSPAAGPAGTRPSFWGEWRRILSARGVAAAYGLRFLDQMVRMVFVPILPLFVLELLADSAQVNSFTGVIIGISAAAAAVFAVVLGRLGDRVGHRRVVIASASCGFLAFLLQVQAAAGWQFLALQAAAGMAHGGMVTGISVLLAKYTRCGEEGAVYGLDNSVNSGARALAPMAGAAIAMTLGFRAVFGAAAMLYLAAAGLAIWGLPRAFPAGSGSGCLAADPRRESRP
jgi:DHA1 family multidrug resistance protein-like MFS transporter